MDVSLSVKRGEIIAVVGSNGVGKTTLLRTLAGILRPASGTISFGSDDITRLKSHERVRRGLVLVPEGRRLFTDLTVDDNIRLGAFRRKPASATELRDDMERCYELFPDLKRRTKQLAGTLSGGQQQMVAVARGLMSKPSLLLLDEPSLGLAPLVIRQIFNTLVRLREELGLSIVLVEQDANAALNIADRGFVMQRARIVMTGTGKELRDDPLTREIYFGRAS